jgi:hypothetical protein
MHMRSFGGVTNILSYMDKSAGCMSKMDLTQWSQKGAIVWSGTCQAGYDLHKPFTCAPRFYMHLPAGW